MLLLTLERRRLELVPSSRGWPAPNMLFHGNMLPVMDTTPMLVKETMLNGHVTHSSVSMSPKYHKKALTRRLLSACSEMNNSWILKQMFRRSGGFSLFNAMVTHL